MTVSSMTAGMASPRLRRRDGVASGRTPRPPPVMAGLVPAIPIRRAPPCQTHRDKPGHDNADAICECGSFLGGENLDQLAAAGVDFRMLAPPLHRDFLEFDAALL